MRSILLVSALLIAIASCIPTYNGFQYLGRGFDVAFADLRPLDIESLGNSFGKFNVMQADVDDDIQWTPLAATEQTFTTVSFNTLSQMSNNKSSGISISASYDNWGLSGQGSLDSNKWANSVLNQSSEYYTSFSSATSSNLQLIAGRVTPSFTYSASQLPTTFAGNEQIFVNFIKKYGTHYIISTLLGGRQNFWTVVNSTQKTALGGRSAAGGVSVNSRKLVNATLGGTTNQDKADADTLISSGAVTHVYAVGGDISLVTNTRDFTGWINSILAGQFPLVPVTMVMQNYIDLVPADKQDALREALIEYHAGSLKEAITPTKRNQITAFYSLPANPVNPNACALNNQRCSNDVNDSPTTIAPGETSGAISVVSSFVLVLMFVVLSMM